MKSTAAGEIHSRAWMPPSIWKIEEINCFINLMISSRTNPNSGLAQSGVCANFEQLNLPSLMSCANWLHLDSTWEVDGHSVHVVDDIGE